MSEITITRAMPGRAAQVWSIIVNLEGWAEAISGIQKVERLDDGAGFKVGTRWRETRTLFGKTATEEMEVTSIEDGRSYVVEAESHGARYVSTWTVEPDGDAANLTMHFAAQPTGTLSRLMAATIGRLFEGPTRKAMEADFDDIAKAVAST